MRILQRTCLAMFARLPRLRGLRLMRLGEGDLVRVVSVVPSTELDPEDAPPLERLVEEDVHGEAAIVGGD